MADEGHEEIGLLQVVWDDCVQSSVDGAVCVDECLIFMFPLKVLGLSNLIFLSGIGIIVGLDFDSSALQIDKF